MSATAMPRIIKAYVRYVDAVNRVLGYFVMYLTLAMMGLLEEDFRLPLVRISAASREKLRKTMKACGILK